MVSKSRKRKRPALPKLPVIDAGKSGKPDTTTFTDSLITAVANMGDIDDACATASEWAGHQFDIANAAELEACEQEIAVLEADSREIEAELPGL